MKLLLDDLHLVIFLGICMVASIVAWVAAASVREFVREHEPKLALQFAFAPRRSFLSLQSGRDRDSGQDQFFRWLGGGGAMELIEKHPHFLMRWKWYRRAGFAQSILICLWLVVCAWRLTQGGLNVG
jgi:hypothetical protein